MSKFNTRGRQFAPRLANAQLARAITKPAPADSPSRRSEIGDLPLIIRTTMETPCLRSNG